MKFFLIPFMVILYIISVGILGVIIPFALLLVVFNPFGFDVRYLDEGVLHFIIIVLSWLIPYYPLRMLHKFLLRGKNK